MLRKDQAKVPRRLAIVPWLEFSKQKLTEFWGPSSKKPIVHYQHCCEWLQVML
jgi:hypothetical protein